MLLACLVIQSRQEINYTQAPEAEKEALEITAGSVTWKFGINHSSFYGSESLYEDYGF